MNNPYHEYKNLSKCTLQERIAIITEVALEMLKQGGRTVEEMKETIPLFEDDEMYESAAGVTKAIELFEQNPQLSIF